jgi:molybdopterin molybdotransferase
LSEYDPNSLRVEDGKKIIQTFSKIIAKNLTVEKLPIWDALGRVLAKDVISPINVPSHDNAAMDGYAFRSKILSQSNEKTVELKISGKIFAGDDKVHNTLNGCCHQIMTGAMMPSDCDTVVPQEFVEANDHKIKFLRSAVNPLDNRRLKGEDLLLGKPALKAGKIIKPSDLGVLASIGMPEVHVFRKLRVSFFSTGDELRSLGQSLPEGCVYDSNRYTIFGMLKRIGVEIVDLGVVPDDPKLLEIAFLSAANCSDVIITSGGVSVGEADHTKAVMKKLGDVGFWKVAMRPGRPMVFGKIWADKYKNNDVFSLLFGLPGNPVAVMVTFYIFVREAILQMMGSDEFLSKLVFLKSAESYKKKPGRTEYRRANIIYESDNVPSVKLTGSQGSGILRSMSEADCLVVLDHDTVRINIGDLVPVLIFDGLI